MREGRIAARLQHPGAVTVRDVTQDDGRPVLVMEYVPAHSLAERGVLPAERVAHVGAQAAAALVLLVHAAFNGGDPGQRANTSTPSPTSATAAVASARLEQAVAEYYGLLPDTD